MKSSLKNGHFGRDEQGYEIRRGVAVAVCKEMPHNRTQEWEYPAVERKTALEESRAGAMLNADIGKNFAFSRSGAYCSNQAFVWRTNANWSDGMTTQIAYPANSPPPEFGNRKPAPVAELNDCPFLIKNRRQKRGRVDTIASPGIHIPQCQKSAAFNDVFNFGLGLDDDSFDFDRMIPCEALTERDVAKRCELNRSGRECTNVERPD